MAQAMAEAIGRQRDFVADASTQLRNPLATAGAPTGERRAAHRPRAGPRRARRAPWDEAERLEELLDGLLAMARVESGHAELAGQDVSQAGTAAGHGLDPRVPRRRTGADRARPPRGPAGNGPRRRHGPHPGRPPRQRRHSSFRARAACAFAPRGTWTTEQSSSRHGRRPGCPAGTTRRAAAALRRSPEHQNVPGTGLGLAIADEIAASAARRLDVTANTPRRTGLRAAPPPCPAPH
ncbi:hypothetical protein ACFSNO_27345 [Streptomyces cirratus]